MFGDYVHRIYPIELEIITDITDTDRSDSYIDLHIQIDSNGQLESDIKGPDLLFFVFL
jgi:hypothetical protein